MLSLAPFALTRGTVLPQPGARASIVSAASTTQLSDELRQLQPAQPALTMDATAVGFHTGLLKSGLLARNRDWARVHARTQAKAKRRRPPPLSDRHDDGALLFPGLATRPFHDPACVADAVALLERYASLVRDEAAALGARRLQQYRDHDDALLHENGDWSVHYLSLEGSDTAAQRAQTPLTARLVDAIPRTTGHAFLSVLAPGTHILPHCGPCNYRLRLQLGLSVPKSGSCSIRVGGEAREWSEGKVLILDDAFEHEVWNDSDEQRVILIVDVWHPDFSDAEVAWMAGTRAERHRRSGGGVAATAGAPLQARLCALSPRKPAQILPHPLHARVVATSSSESSETLASGSASDHVLPSLCRRLQPNQPELSASSSLS